MLLPSLGLALLAHSAFSAQTPPSQADVTAQASSLGGSLVVPQYIPVFNPTGILSVTYSTSTGPVSIGGAQQLSPLRVGSTPAIAFNPLAGSASSPLYMLAMVDMDLPSIYLPGVLHWAQTDLTLDPNTGALTSNVKPAAQYAPPAPPQGAPATHRYVLLLYAQPANFKLAPKYQNMPTTLIPNTARLNFLFSDFLSSGGFGSPIGGNFFKSTYDGTTGINTVVVTATGIPAGNTAGQTAAASSPAAGITASVASMAGSSAAASGAAPVSATMASSTSAAPAATASKASSASSKYFNSFTVWTISIGGAFALAELVFV